MALDFAGGYLALADNSVLDITADLTFGCWIHADSDAGNQTFMGKYTTTGNQRQYTLATGGGGTNGILRSVISDDGTSGSADVVDSASSQITTGAWHHICCRFIPSTETRNFLNGSSVAAKTSSVRASIHSGTGDFNIASFGGGSNTFDGSVAEAFVYNDSLEDEEIAALAKGVRPSQIRPDKLVLYMPLINTQWYHDLTGLGTFTDTATITSDGQHPPMLPTKRGCY